ncbi:MAG: rhomboid family intramembrane serine protease, partial [Anaerolineae bacterium]
LYLWIFGDNVEDALGHIRYLLFYLAGGVAAAITHIVFDPNSTIPTVGASGAIAAALGAYLILYPQSKVQTIVPVGRAASVTLVPAIFVLGLWFVLQLFQGIASLGVDEEVGGVAVWAHIGGFVFGLALAKLLAKPRSEYGGANFDANVRRPRLA